MEEEQGKRSKTEQELIKQITDLKSNANALNTDELRLKKNEAEASYQKAKKEFDKVSKEKDESESRLEKIKGKIESINLEIARIDKEIDSSKKQEKEIEDIIEAKHKKRIDLEEKNREYRDLLEKFDTPSEARRLAALEASNNQFKIAIKNVFGDDILIDELLSKKDSEVKHKKDEYTKYIDEAELRISKVRNMYGLISDALKK